MIPARQAVQARSSNRAPQATSTSPKVGATIPPPPDPSDSTASIRTGRDIHGTHRSPTEGPKTTTLGSRQVVVATAGEELIAGDGYLRNRLGDSDVKN